MTPEQEQQLFESLNTITGEVKRLSNDVERLSNDTGAFNQRFSDYSQSK